MKHVAISRMWEYSTEPFPAYRCQLVFGRRKHDRAFLPVKDIITDPQEGVHLLPEGKFRVIKTRQKGTILVVPGEDTTRRCLLFAGANGGFRGGVCLIEDATTAKILKACAAGNACQSAIAIAALMDVGETIAFRSYGRRCDEVYAYTWTGEDVEKKHYSWSEWEARKTIEEDGEVL